MYMALTKEQQIQVLNNQVARDAGNGLKAPSYEQTDAARNISSQPAEGDNTLITRKAPDVSDPKIA